MVRVSRLLSVLGLGVTLLSASVVYGTSQSVCHSQIVTRFVPTSDGQHFLRVLSLVCNGQCEEPGGSTPSKCRVSAPSSDNFCWCFCPSEGEGDEPECCHLIFDFGAIVPAGPDDDGMPSIGRWSARGTCSTDNSDCPAGTLCMPSAWAEPECLWIF
jgi:hypothetical protein